MHIHMAYCVRTHTPTHTHTERVICISINKYANKEDNNNNNNEQQKGRPAVKSLEKQ